MSNLHFQGRASPHSISTAFTNNKDIYQWKRAAVHTLSYHNEQQSTTPALVKGIMIGRQPSFEVFYYQLKNHGAFIDLVSGRKSVSKD
jgi:hypothetical protein